MTTKEGVSGLKMEQNTHFLLAETPEEFVTAITTLCDNDLLRQTLSKNGRKLIESRYNWDSIATMLDGVWQKASHE